MKTICIIPCGSKKIWDINTDTGPTEARKVYVGPFAKKCRQYAETFYPGSWCILSAKYGFLFPDDNVAGPYNTAFNKKGTNPIANEKLTRQAKKKGLNEYHKIIVLGGKNYIKRVRQVFSDKKVSAPLEKCKGIGYMMKKLNEAILNNRQI
jgi:hypothetical protein